MSKFYHNNVQDIGWLSVSTTGHNVNFDRILSIRAYSCAQRRWIIDISFVGSDANSHLHQFSKIAKQLYLFCQSSLVITDNKDLTLSFLKKLYKAFAFSFNVKFMDTLSVQHLMKLPSLTLSRLEDMVEQNGLSNCIASIYQVWLQQPTTDLSPIATTLPQAPGVYFFKNELGVPLYIGKSKNIRQRVQSHLAARLTHPKAYRYVSISHTIDYQLRNGEFGALLLESQLVKQYKPMFNRRLRRVKEWVGIKAALNRHGYLELSIEPIRGTVSSSSDSIVYGVFRSYRQAKTVLQNVQVNHELCLRLCHLQKGHGACFSRQLNKCLGACEGKEPAAIYNERLLDGLRQYQQQAWPYKGAIAIAEPGNHSKICWHTFKDWRYLGSCETLDACRQLTYYPNEVIDDFDAVILLKQHLQTNQQVVNLC